MSFPRLVSGCVLSMAVVCHGFSGAIPEEWFLRSSPSTNDLNGISYGDGLFVAAGAQGTLLTSANGMDWTPQSVATTSTFLFSTYAFRHFAGGNSNALIRFSDDGINWTNGISTAGPETIHGMAGYYVAIGRNPNQGISFILNSANGAYWNSNAVSTNALFAIARAASTTGHNLPDAIYVAVGDQGTILTSMDGANWIPRESGTTVPLRSAVYHRGRMIVGGDSGVVLTSTNGSNWTSAAPASFDILGLASSGNAVIAVGRLMNSGRLHASLDGLSWPGQPLELSAPLHAVAFGHDFFVAAGTGGQLIQSSTVPGSDVNIWTKPSSGYWEEAFWSCERLPSIDNRLIAFTNSGWKALAIGPGTTANFPESLEIADLAISAPDGSANQLLMNYAGTNVSLNAYSLSLGPNASLVSLYSAIDAHVFSLLSPALFAENSRMSMGRILAASHLALSNSSLNAGVLDIRTNGLVDQTGGSSQFLAVVMHGGALFRLNHGTVSASHLCLQQLPGFPYTASLSNGVANFIQSGGEMTVDELKLGFPPFLSYQSPLYDRRGEFVLEEGELYSRAVRFFNGEIVQSGGIHHAEIVEMPAWKNKCAASYSLAGGTLVSDLLDLGKTDSPDLPSRGNFLQSGGVHTNNSMVLNGEFRIARRLGITGVEHTGTYSLFDGFLVSSNALVNRGFFEQTGGTNIMSQLSIIGAGKFALTGGELLTVNTLIAKASCDPDGNTRKCHATLFMQSGGRHIVANTLWLSGPSSYTLTGGSLSAENIHIGPNAVMDCPDGMISNEGMFSMQGGTFRPGNQLFNLGRLQVLAPISWIDAPPANALALDFSNSQSAILRFRDSRDVEWTGVTLLVLGWTPNGDRIFVGATAHGLTAEQLSKVSFSNPEGWPHGVYRATILSNGELVPAVPPPLQVWKDSNSLTLAWPGNYNLLTSTNIHGPYSKVAGAGNPCTISFTNSEQYFRLGMPDE